MIKVVTSAKFYEEKCYAIKMLFSIFLGLDIGISKNGVIEETVINLDNKKRIILKDHFFSTLLTQDYLFINNIPSKVDSGVITNLGDLPLLSLYGSATVNVEPDQVVFESDMVASTFFMLTRWEEAVIDIRDMHGRFPASQSLAVKHGFIDRPIVNEYVELLWSAISLLDPTATRMRREFNFLLTHDVDLPRLWWNPKDFIKSIGGALLKRKSLKEAFTLTRQYIRGKDPFNVFDWMMNLSEKYSLTSHFFFMSGGTSVKDNFYKIDHPIVKKLIHSINERNHKIGFHPSFNAYNDIHQFTKELDLLKNVSEVDIASGRHHFLRFEVPTTWQIWEDTRMEWDSTMSYHDREGFRCGVCYPFPVFNILTRQELRLIERPLTVMEGSFITYQKTVPDEMLLRIKELIDTTRFYGGEFVFLWHNSAFRIPAYNEVYEKVLKYGSNAN